MSHRAAARARRRRQRAPAGTVAVVATSATASSTAYCTAGSGSRRSAAAVGPGARAGGGEEWPRPASDHDWMYDAVLAQLRDVIVPRTDDPWRRHAGKGIARLIKYLAQVDMYGDVVRGSGARRPDERCSGNAPASVEDGRGAAAVGGRRRARSATRTTCACCGAGWPGRPNWPGRRWACWPTVTGPSCVDERRRAMSQMFGVDLDQRRDRADLPHARPRGRRLPRRGDDGPMVGDGDYAGSPGTSRSASSAVGPIARPGRTPTSATAAPGCGTTSAAYPWELAIPGRVLRSAVAASVPNGTCATSSGRTVCTCGCSSRCAATPSPTRIRARSRWTSSSRRSWRRTRTPIGVVPFLKGAHFDQAGHVTGAMVLHGEEIAIDCYSVRDRSWGPRPLGRPKRPPGDGTARRTGRTGAGDVRWCRAIRSVPPGRARPGSSTPCPGPSRRAGVVRLPPPREATYGHILAGERRVTFDATTGWPLTLEIEAVDEFGRLLSVRGEAISRHWRGHGGDSLVHWTWDGGVEGWGEDQSYVSRDQWERNRAAGPRLGLGGRAGSDRRGSRRSTAPMSWRDRSAPRR